MSIDPIEIASGLIRRHEGFEQFPYKCSAGKLTIGFGFNLDDEGLSERESAFILKCRITQRVEFLESFSFWMELNPVRKAALIDMAYQLGRTKFNRFRNTIAALHEGNYQKAHDEILDSQYAREDTPMRAKRIARLVRDGSDF